jgi:hypothetical protein
MHSLEGIREAVASFERRPGLLGGDGERFAGYGVMALPFESGHVLALRRYPASSIGRAYTAVWVRDPEERWTFYSDASPEESCARYASSALYATVTAPIRLWWPAPRVLHVEVPGATISWRVELSATVTTRVLSALARALPASAWRQVPVLRVAATLAGLLLARGRLALHGRMPNGHRFRIAPRQIFSIRSSRATIGGRDLGSVRALPAQVRLADLWLPQAGIFAVADTCFEGPGSVTG